MLHGAYYVLLAVAIWLVFTIFTVMDTHSGLLVMLILNTVDCLYALVLFHVSMLTYRTNQKNIDFTLFLLYLASTINLSVCLLDHSL